MTEVTLEPCPLCNGYAVMWEDGDPKYPWCVTFEHADECPLYAVPADFFRSYPTEAEAAAAWNQRHTRPASTEPTDALAEGLRSFWQVIADNNPNETIADNGMTVWDGIQMDASGLFPRILAALTRTDALAEAREADAATITALRQRVAELEGERDSYKAALEAIIKDRDEQCFDREVFRQGGPYGDYWSPHASMVSSSVIHEGRTALERRGSE